MNQEETIKESLIKKFSFLDGAVNITRPRRISVGVSLDKFMQVFDYLAKGLEFGHLCTITGLDEKENMSFIYHLAADSGIVVNLKTSAPKANPLIKTVTHYFPGADCYEREMVDLLGVKVEGLSKGNRYPLTDDWPKDQFPLRKDWKSKQALKTEGPTNA